MNRVPENESCKQGKDETSTRQYTVYHIYTRLSHYNCFSSQGKVIICAYLAKLQG